MTESERVFDAFRNCVATPKCLDCPWTECEILGNEKVEIPKDLALAVLRELAMREKAQQPRVLTLDELQPDVLVWIEVPYSGEIWPALLRETDWLGYPAWAMRGYAVAAYYLHDGYGRDWRCWSAKPTDEQRKAVAWDD